MPVPMARMFGSKMMSAGSMPACLVRARRRGGRSRPCARSRLGLAGLVEGHDHHARAVAADGARLGEEVGLAFLQADRVGDPLALQHLRPASMTLHFELSTITGIRAISGSAREQVEERGHGPLAVEHALVHVHVEDVGAPATWSSATSTALA